MAWVSTHPGDPEPARHHGHHCHGIPRLDGLRAHRRIGGIPHADPAQAHMKVAGGDEVLAHQGVQLLIQLAGYRRRAPARDGKGCKPSDPAFNLELATLPPELATFLEICLSG